MSQPVEPRHDQHAALIDPADHFGQLRPVGSGIGRPGNITIIIPMPTP
jgi:hypothetical protein